MEWRFEEPIEEEAKENGDSSDPIQQQRNSNETAPAQPQSESDGSLRAAQTHSGAPNGTFVAPPTIEEVALAHADLLRILKPPRIGFTTGYPWVGFLHTAPEPVYTVTRNG